MTRVLMLAANPVFTSHATAVRDHRVAAVDRAQLDQIVELGGFSSLVGGPQGPDLVVVGDEFPIGEALVLGEAVRREAPGALLMLVAEPGRVSILDAMRAGFRDVISSTASAHEIESAWQTFEGNNVRRLHGHGAQIQPDLQREASRVVVVTGPRGGVGRSSIAVNLAVSLAAEAPKDTVLVDLDLHFGDIGLMLNLDPIGTIADVFEAPASMDSLVLKTFLTQHAAGLWVLCSSPSPAVADKATAASVSRLLRRLAAEFRYVVVDTSARLDALTVAAVEEATDHIAVTSMDVASANALRRQLSMLAAAGSVPESRHVVLNRAERAHGVGPREIESLLGMPVDVVIPTAPEVLAATNLGVPVAWKKRGGPFTKAMVQLTQRVHDGELSLVNKHRGVDVA